MGRLTIYREVAVGNPTVVAVCAEVEYHGGWMEEEYVTVKVQSPTPVAFAIDDYVTYRGQRYSISYDPQKLKKASSGSHGEGFTYDGLKLYSEGSRLKNVAMKDIVLNDNQLSYTSLGKFSFYCQSVEDLADRIQANLNRNSSDWRVLTPNWDRTDVRLEFTMQDSSEREELWGEYYDGSESAGKSEINISIDDNSCWDALKCAYNDFGLSYRIVGKTVVIGGKPIAAGHVFMYGKNNGLREISDSGTDDQRIITKLFAYGSEKNLPLNYYGNTLVICNAPILQKTQSSPVSGTSFFHYIVDVKYDKKLFTRSIGDDNYQLTLKKESGDSPHTTRLAFAGKPSSAVWSDEVMQQYSSKVDITVPANSIVPEKHIGGNFEIVGGLNKNLWPQTLCNKTDASYPGALSVNRLMLPGFPQQSVKDYFTATANWSKYSEKDFYPHLLEIYGRIHQVYGTLQWGDIYLSEDAYDPYITSGKCLTIGAREGTVNFDGNGNTQEILPSIAGGTDNVVLFGSSIKDNGYVQEADDFDIWIKDAAIAWDELYGAATETVVLSMTSGYCTGRDFEVSGVERAEKNGVSCWKFTLKRSPDSSMNRLFPYADSGVSGYCQIVANDTFVVTGIELPDEYVEEASVRLFIAAVDALDELSEPKRSYSPKIDQIFMQRDLDENGQSAMYYKLYPGIGLSIRDIDLEIDKTVYIDTLTIKEFGDAEIATYDVTLRDEKELGLMEQIQVSVGGGVQTRGGSATAANGVHTASESTRSKSADRLSGNETHNAWGQTYWENGKPKDVDGDMAVNGGISIGETGKGISEDGDATFGDVGADKVTVSESAANVENTVVIDADGIDVTKKENNDVVGSTAVDAEGLTLGGYSEGLLGTGGVFKMINGKSYLEADSLYVRMKAYFDTLEIRRYIHSGGNRVASAAGCKVTRVVQENPNGSFYCYFKANDGDDKITNDFVAGDLAYCHTTNLEGESPNAELNQQDYWRLVMETGSVNAHGVVIVRNGVTEPGIADTTATEHYIKLANTTQPVLIGEVEYRGMRKDSDTAPKAGDDVVQLGNVNDPARRGAIVEAVSGAGCAPTYRIYQGLGADSSNLYTFTSPKVDMGYNLNTRKAYLNVFGDFYVGEEGNNPNTYVRFTQGDGTQQNPPSLEIKAKIDAASGSPILKKIPNVYTLPVTSQTGDSMSSEDYKEGDIWFLPVDWGVWTAGTMLVCTHDKNETIGLQSQDWAKKDSYTDDTAFNNYITQVLYGTSGQAGSEVVAQAMHAIKAALNQNTTIEGGLVLTQMLVLKNENNGQSSAGIRGKSSENDIALWLGGPMADWESLTPEQQAVANRANYAQSLFRFDGSGYLAGGNISWKLNGDTTVQGTIKADNFFHAVCFFLEGGTYRNNVLCFYRWDASHDETYAPFHDGQYYTPEEIDRLSDHHLHAYSPGFTATTGTADVVMCMPRATNWADNPSVTLPLPEDFRGKIVEVSAFSYTTGERTIGVTCCAATPRMVGLVNLDENGRVVSNAPAASATIHTGGVARFLSVERENYNGQQKQWVWTLLANQTGGDVIINGGGSGGGSVTSVGMSVPQGFSVTGSPITESGIFTIGFANGYALPTTADVNKGVTAYESLADYLTRQEALDTFVLTSALAGYVTIDGEQTISGLKTFSSNVQLGAGTAVKAYDKGTDLLAYKSGTWGGVTGEHWFVGAAGVNGFIRSYGELKRWKDANTQYRIWDASNFTPSNYLLSSAISEWAKAANPPTLDEVADGSTRKLANYLQLTGGTLRGTLTVNDNITIGSGKKLLFGTSAKIYFDDDTIAIDMKDEDNYDVTNYVYHTGNFNPSDYTNVVTAIQVNGQTLAPVSASYPTTFNIDLSGYATTSDLSDYIKGVSVYGSSLHPDSNRVVNIPYADINTPGVIQIGTGLVNDNEGHTTVDTTVIASQEWADGRYLPLTAGSSKPLTGDLYLSEDLVLNNDKLIYFKDHSGTLCDALSHSYDEESGIDTLYLGFDFRKNSHSTEIYGNELTLLTGLSARPRLVITFGGNVGIGTTTPQAKLDVAGNVKANGATLTNLLSWDVQNADNLVISNNKIQLSVSGTPHNIVLFEGSTASLTSYAKFYERPMVKTGTSNGTPIYTNVALVSEVEAKQNTIHFFNTKNSNTEVSFSNIYLPLNYQGGGTVYLDLSDYATTSALSGYLPLTGGSLSNDLTIASNKYLRFGSNSGGLLIHNTTNGNNSLDISANRINLNVENGLFCNGVEVPTTAGVASISTSICGSLYSAIQNEFVAKAGSSMTGALSMGNGINVNFGDCSVTSNVSAQGNIQAGKILKLMGNYVAVTAGDNADANFTVNGNIVATRTWVGNGWKVKDVEIVDDDSVVVNGDEVFYGAQFTTNGMLTLARARLSIYEPEYTSDLVNDSGFISQTFADGRYLPLTAGSSKPLTGNIAYKGTKATKEMITFIDNKSDQWGNGIAIGGGGATIIGGGESAVTMIGQLPKVTVDGVEYINGGSEVMYIGNDTSVSIFTNLGTASGWANRKEFFFDTGGSLSVPFNVVSKAPNNSAFRLQGANYDIGLHLGAGGTNRGIYEFSPKDGWLLYFDASNTILNHGNVGIGTASPAYKLDVNEVIRSTVGFVARPLNGDYAGFNNEGITYMGASASSAVQLMDFAYDSTNNIATVKFPVRPQVKVGTDWLEVVVAKSDENGIEFRGSEDGTYTFGYGSGRGDIYAGAGDFSKNLTVGNRPADADQKLYVGGSAVITGNVGIGTRPTGTYAVEIDGSVYASSSVHADSFVNNSDIRMKDVTRFIEPSVHDIAIAPIIEFAWKKGDGSKNIGSIAQYWQTVFPQAVHEGGDGMLSIEYANIALASAITAARHSLDNERRIAELEQRVAELEDELAAMVSQHSETTDN